MMQSTCVLNIFGVMAEIHSAARTQIRNDTPEKIRAFELNPGYATQQVHTLAK